MAFTNKEIIDEWVRNNPARMVDLLEQNIDQHLQDALETMISDEYKTPSALYVAYRTALDVLKGTDDTTAIQYLEGKLAENEP